MNSLSENIQSAPPGLNVDLLESSFARLAPRAQEFVEAFYEKLFETYPETQRFFTTTDMTEQKNKLVSALILVIENLRNPEALKGALTALGRKHENYGIGASYYPMVGDSLLNTLSAFLDQDWTPEVKQAWTEAYGVISEAMLSGYTVRNGG